MKIDIDRIIKVGLGLIIATYGASYLMSGSQMILEGLNKTDSDPEADREAAIAGA